MNAAEGVGSLVNKAFAHGKEHVLGLFYLEVQINSNQESVFVLVAPEPNLEEATRESWQ